jgi:hypothetical protein
VEAARDVRARDDVEHRVVVAHLPGAEAFAEIAVEIHQATRNSLSSLSVTNM